MENQTSLNGGTTHWALITPMSKQTSNFKTRLKNKGFTRGIAGMKNFSHFFPTIEDAKIFCKELEKSRTPFSVLFVTDEQIGEIFISYKTN